MIEALPRRCPDGKLWNPAHGTGVHSPVINRLRTMPANIDRKLKIALDETRLLILGVQILLGFEFQCFFQDGLDGLARGPKYLSLGSLGLACRNLNRSIHAALKAIESDFDSRRRGFGPYDGRNGPRDNNMPAPPCFARVTKCKACLFATDAPELLCGTRLPRGLGFKLRGVTPSRRLLLQAVSGFHRTLASVVTHRRSLLLNVCRIPATFPDRLSYRPASAPFQGCLSMACQFACSIPNQSAPAGRLLPVLYSSVVSFH